MNPAPLPRDLLALQAAVAGRYSIEREIGRGGMGRVYLARDVALERPVAIKVLPPEHAADGGMRARFLAEARTAARLSHPNIVPIFAVEDIGEFVYFVMAYVEGQTLRQRVADRGALPTGTGARILRDVAWALAYAHSQGVVHRDVKPENILLESGTERALVTDFGIAQVHSGAGGPGRDQVYGTPEFMSPEQASGKRVDHRSDLYSLGVVAFYVFTGRVPFTARTAPAVLAQHIGKPPPRLGTVAPGVPRAIAALVDQCLAKSPDDRAQRDEQVLEVLSGTIEQRRELSPAVRVFITERRAAETTTAVTVALAPWLAILEGSLFFSGQPLLGLAGVAVLGAVFGLPLVRAFLSARRLVRAGHSRDEAVEGLEQEVERRREELIHLFGRNFEADARQLRRDGATWLVFAGLLVGVLFFEPRGQLWIGIGAALSALGGLVLVSRADRRADRQGKSRLRLWRGPIGRALFDLVDSGNEVRTAAPALTQRPTEVAIGMVVLGLFEALPKPMRASLGDLPQVVRALEADGRRMRDNMRELDGLLVDAPLRRTGGPGAGANEPESAQRVVELLRETRAEAASRLTQAVAALEKLRIDLLMLRGGSITLAGVTGNLGEARELSAQVRRLLAGMEEVQRTLARPAQ